MFKCEYSKIEQQKDTDKVEKFKDKGVWVYARSRTNWVGNVRYDGWLAALLQRTEEDEWIIEEVQCTGSALEVLLDMED